jgi:hypothetical protein
MRDRYANRFYEHDNFRTKMLDSRLQRASEQACADHSTGAQLLGEFPVLPCAEMTKKAERH